ncbi:hypothetical protein M2262_003899 [Pseudomonas sp. BIGb0408]|uniref:Uncharacterized protein n=1 Tax=Phytopseudomonas flavescens TaxID=29435 RepID=A0A7Y9XJR6_9GAMM|nr:MULTISPECIES: hypothetical protein [Pseudomonas]MCW2293849.1 hypothetical protein [Pseudomonas sp. BIGb0408]NYH71581.1 hypothetical protein [Pseudomonas flavescens]
MDWLRKHWKGTLGWTAGIVGSVVVSKIADHYLDGSIISQFWQILVSIWTSINTTIPVPAWLAFIILAIGIALGWKLYRLQRSDVANKGLSDQQKAVLQSIAWFHEQGINPAFHNLKYGTDLQTLELQVALDELTSAGLVTCEIDMNHSIEQREVITLASLTPKGRACALEIQRQSAQ